MNLEKFEEITDLYIYNKDVNVSRRTILLDIDKVIYFAPFIMVKDKVIDYTRAYLVNGDSIELYISFEELTKRFSI
jgi:hypothetical protein